LDAERKKLQHLLDERSSLRSSSSSVAVGKIDSGSGASNKQVVMYTTATCPACVAAKQYLSRKGIPYEERDVERSPSAAAEFERLGGRAVPLIVVGNETMVGLDPRRLDEMLEG
jgi:glutaredoxin 3